MVLNNSIEFQRTGKTYSFPLDKGYIVKSDNWCCCHVHDCFQSAVRCWRMRMELGNSHWKPEDYPIIYHNGVPVKKKIKKIPYNVVHNKDGSVCLRWRP